MKTGWVVAVVVVALGLVGAGSFVVSPTTSTQGPVDFDDTIAIGLTLEERQKLSAHDRLVPRAQVVYSQYPYVIGYRGIGLAAMSVDDPDVHQQFGYPRSVFVETMASDVRIDDEGYLTGSPFTDWTPANEAVFVVDTGARIPGAAATVPFADRERATEFADRYDGRVLEWDDRDAFEAPASDGSTARSRIDAQRAGANQTVAVANEHLDRSTTLTVGQDADSLARALEVAPPNATIALPPGTYDGPLTIETPVTIRGEDARIVGDGNGSVLTVNSSDVAIVGVSISGVGDVAHPDDIELEDWDAHTEGAYGYADAGITVANGDRVLVSDVEIDTPTAGVIVRDSNGTVVDGLEVRGAETWEAGFMGVVTIRSPIVLQESTFHDGRDGIYTHRSHGVVVRNNDFAGGRFGTHLMYTSDALIDGNCMVGQEMSGVVVMTSPSGTAITDNVLADTTQGILTSGSDSYVGGNLVVSGQQGISTNARNSLYTRNVVVGNLIGLRASSIVPSSRVVDNDVVDNEEHVYVGSGPLRVWSHDGRGNYWSGAANLNRPFTPTGPIDSRLHRTKAASTLADSPVAHTLREVRTSAPGMRRGAVVDTAPRSTYANPARVEAGHELIDRYETTDDSICATVT
ncbi:MAG: NosD domain-containing protein [Natronomonas sp.]